jgi:hypothetical protein
MNKENSKEIKSEPVWVRPNVEKEEGEIERVVHTFFPAESFEISVAKIKEAIKNLLPIELSDEEWSTLENTDSFTNVRIGHIEDVESITEKYNESLSSENKRNVQSIVDGFQEGKEMEMPIIFKNETGQLHLISGNTRLMVARVLSIRPRVLIVEVK